MCFTLFAGTDRPMPRIAFDPQNRGVSVTNLLPEEETIRAWFHKPAVQKIGSDTRCGCGFPNAMYQNGGWPETEWPRKDEEQIADDLRNLTDLVSVLRTVEGDTLELYGIWAGNTSAEPANREEITLTDLLDAQFWFKERVFYTVPLRESSGRSE